MIRSSCFRRIAPVLIASMVMVHAPIAHADSTQATEQLANEAYEAVAAGRYTDGIASYLKAYEISHEATILLNVATIYDRKLHERALAAEFYRRYSVAPGAEPDRVKKVAERLTQLKKEEADEEAARRAAIATQAQQQRDAQTQTSTQTNQSAQPAPESEEARNAGNGQRTAGVVVGVAGVVSLGASMAFGLLAKKKNDDANQVCNGTACSSESGVNDAKTAGTFATVSTITFVGGLVLVGAGITLFVVAPKSRTSSQSAYLSVSPSYAPGGGGLTLHGGF